MPHISITISGRNAVGLPEIIEWVLERKLHFSINFYYQNDLSIDHEDLKLKRRENHRWDESSFDVIEAKFPEHSLLPSLTDRANLAVPHERTCSVGQDYLVFNQHGQDSKCQMKIHETLAQVTIAGPLAIIWKDKIGIQNISVEDKESCRECQWKNWCTGGSPLETIGQLDVMMLNPQTAILTKLSSQKFCG